MEGSSGTQTVRRCGPPVQPCRGLQKPAVPAVRPDVKAKFIWKGLPERHRTVNGC